MSLPPGYRFDSSLEANKKHFKEIVDVLLHDERIYWAKERTPAVIEYQLSSSYRCCCVIKEGEQEELAAWARCISDGEGMGYLADVFVTPQHGRKGLAKALVREVIENTNGPGQSTNFKWCLFTGDAHELYKQHVNFVDTAKLGWAMTRWPDPTRPISTHPPLPEEYRIDLSREAKTKHTEEIITALLEHPGVYWGKSRSRNQVKRQIDRCEGALVLRKREDGSDELVGSARVVTDMVGFGYLCDVFILPKHGKKGLSKALVVEAVENTGGPGASSGWKWWLWTDDAHDLYSRVLDFSQPKGGGREMERMVPNS